MPFNGSGVFQRAFNWVNDAANGILITASRVDSDSNDFASGLSNCITRDGQGKPTAAINWNGQNITNVALINATGPFTVSSTGAFDVSYLFSSIGVAGGAVGFNNSGAVNSYGAPTSTGYFGLAQSFPIVFTTGATEKARIDAAGNMAVGTAVPFSGSGFTYLSIGNSTNGSGVTLTKVDGTRLASFGVNAAGAGAIGTETSQPFSIYIAGTSRLGIDTFGHVFGTAIHNNSSLPTGTTNQYFASGTYTPTLTGTGGFSSITAAVSQWMRVGNVVTVSGSFSAVAAASVQVSIGISLPIPSTLGASGALSGSMPRQTSSTSPGGITAYVNGDTTNNRANAVVLNDGFNGVGNWGFHFTYVIL